MAKRLIVLDPGHEAKDDRGSTQIDGASEITYTLPMTRAIRDALLADYECDVVLTHEGGGMDASGSLAAELRARGELPNKVGADFFLSIHHDAAGNAAARGAALYIWTKARYVNGEKTPRKNYDVNRDDTELAWLPALGWHDAPRSYKLATVMQPLIASALASVGIPWRGTPITCADFAVLRYPNVPCALLETHFGTNQQDDDIMDNPDNIAKVAKGIARAIATGLQLPAKVAPPDPYAVTVLVNGIEVACGARLEGTTTRVDIRPIVEALGGTVEKWNGTRMTANITRKG